MLTFKRKLKLTKAQESRIDSWTGACRTVYNLGIEIRNEAWKNKQQYVNGFELMKQLKDLNSIDWIKDTPTNCLQDAIQRLDKSYKSFFKGSGFPKWANKKKYNSILFKQDKSSILRINENAINIPKLRFIKFIKDSKVYGSIKTVQITKESTGYFICIVTDAKKSIQSQNESQILGIDMGIRYFAVGSNGLKFDNPKHLKQYAAKLRVENRSLSRKNKGSNSWKRQIKRISLLYRKIANTRKDFLHKVSTEIAKVNNTVILENLNVRGMSQNRKLSKHILDCGWGMFRTMLSYKTNVIAIDPKFTSQTCNNCGAKDAKSRISQSKFVCTTCGVECNADENAAKNILDKGIVLIRERKAVA